jgi:hemoglobin
MPLTSGCVDAHSGSHQGVQLNADDADAAQAFLRDHGVEVRRVHEYPWGRFCFFSDLMGTGGRCTRYRLVDGTPSFLHRLARCHHRGMESVYEAAGGDAGLLALARAWHTRVMADEVVSHAFRHGFHPEHTERLAAYWAEALGGPNTFSDAYGDETSVVRIHSGNGPHEEMDRRAIACFDQAMTDVALPEGDPLRNVLHDYFAWATTTAMSRYEVSADDVPDGLPIPRWSWDGLQA